jgi:diguanylate cyclase (GGDEF)-like protein
MSADRSTPAQRAALHRVTQEFADIRRRFDEGDRLREAEWASTHPLSALPVADWEHVLDTVKATLWQAADTLTAAGAASGLNGHTAGVTSDLVQSVTALDRVHAMLARELARGPGGPVVPDDGLATSPAAVQAQMPRPPLALLYVDLDDFRPIDVRRNRTVGDEVFSIIALRLRGVMRAPGAVRAVRDDALACTLDDWRDHEQLLLLVAQLADAASAPVTVGAIDVTARPTIGIATRQAGGASAEILLQRADVAMTRAKRRHSSYAFFDRRADA